MQVSSQDANDAPKRKQNAYPKGAFFVLGMEFSERFSFYGMRTLLVLYFVNVHTMPEHIAKLIYHLFVSLSYLTPIVGSLLADGLLGKYSVIKYFSGLYVLGHAMMTCGAFFDPFNSPVLLQMCDFGGLVLIALANGGLKPCISAFAGDQFDKDASDKRKKFFSYFYASVNYGALLSILITPIIRSRAQCFGSDTCYPLAFGVPALFMLVAFVLFLMGRRYYKIANEESTLWKVIKCMCYALFNKAKSPSTDWATRAESKYSSKLISDVSSLMKLLFIFLPIIPFWALLDQQGSSWQLQATRMSGKVGPATILPDQMLMLNPLGIIVLVPIFESVVYPVLAKGGFLVRPLRRMAWGGIFIASSFLASALLQVWIDKELNWQPTVGQTRTLIVNDAHCPLEILGYGLALNETKAINPGDHLIFNLNESSKFRHVCPSSSVDYANVSLRANRTNLIGNLLYFSDVGVEPTNDEFRLDKIRGGRSRLSIFFPLYLNKLNGTKFLRVKISSQQGSVLAEKDLFSSNNAYIDLKPLFWHSTYGTNEGYTLIISICDASDEFQCRILNETNTYRPDTGESKILIMSRNSKNLTSSDSTHPAFYVDMVPGNRISVAWQVPQFLLITIGEILFAVSGLDFSYSQATTTTKSVVLALWYVNNAMGDFLATFVSGLNLIPDLQSEFVFYSSLVFVATLLFAVSSSRYKYANHDEEAEVPEKSVIENKYARVETHSKATANPLWVSTKM